MGYTQSGLFIKHNLSAIGGTDPEALTVPAGYADETVHVYAFVIGASSTNEGQASTTAYLGTVGSGSSSVRNTGGSGTVNG